MRTDKVIKLTVYREEDISSLSKRKQRRLKNILAKKLFDVVSRFNGTVTIRVHISAKGNA